MGLTVTVFYAKSMGNFSIEWMNESQFGRYVDIYLSTLK